jgi:hypothetical protein
MEQQCEDCKERKRDVFRRTAIPRLLCSDCYAKALASDRPSMYVSVPSRLKATRHHRARSPTGGVMMTFKASDDLIVEAKTDEEPLLVLRDLGSERDGDPLRLIVYPGEIQALVSALLEAEMWLANAVQE